MGRFGDIPTDLDILPGKTVRRKADDTGFEVADIGGQSSLSWNDVTDKPVTFTPSTHSHAQSDIIDLTSDLASKASASHNHDAIYSQLNHNHNATYAPINHFHNTYALLANGATAMNFGTNTAVKVTATATATYTTTVPSAGTHLTLMVITAGTVSFTITFGAGFRSVPTLATGTIAARIYLLHFISDGTQLYQITRTAAMVA